MKQAFSDIPVVILAAGQGSRMRAGGIDQAKPLLPLCDRAILSHQVQMLRLLGVTRFVVVDNEEDEAAIEDAFARGLWHSRKADGVTRGGVLVQYVQVGGQGHMDALRLALAEEECSGPVLVLLGDIFLRLREGGLDGYPRMMTGRTAAVVAAREEADPAAMAENFALWTDDRGRVQRLEEKPSNPDTKLKGVGLYLFSPSSFDVLRNPGHPHLTAALQVMVDRGQEVMAGGGIGADVNVNRPSDFYRANLLALATAKTRGEAGYVAQSAQVEQGVVLSGCVVMNEAVLRGQARLSRVVVMPGTAVDLDGARLDRCILSNQSIIQVD